MCDGSWWILKCFWKQKHGVDGIGQKKEHHLSGLSLLLIFSSKSNSVCRSSYGPMADEVDYFFKAYIITGNTVVDFVGCLLEMTIPCSQECGILWSFLKETVF